MQFKDRMDARNQLAEKLTVDRPHNTIVLALPRGGVPLGIQLSATHSLLFDVVLAKKIVHPLQLEFAIGAVAENGEPILNEAVNVEQNWIDTDTSRVRNEMKNRRELYNEVLPQHSLDGKNVIIVDNGLATGMTMFAAIQAVKSQKPNRVLVTVPIIPNDTNRILENMVDEVIAIEVPAQFKGAVGAYYQDFSQVSDKEVEEMIIKS